MSEIKLKKVTNLPINSFMTYTTDRGRKEISQSEYKWLEKRARNQCIEKMKKASEDS